MKTQFIINAQTQFLRDTCQFYTSRNRATGPAGMGCLYIQTPTSPGCAIGRHIPNKKLCALWSESQQYPNGAFVDMIPQDMLGPLAVLDIPFLHAVQCLHDRAHYWTESGLSMPGKCFVRTLCMGLGIPVEQVLVDETAKNTN